MTYFCLHLLLGKDFEFLEASSARICSICWNTLLSFHEYYFGIKLKHEIPNLLNDQEKEGFKEPKISKTRNLNSDLVPEIDATNELLEDFFKNNDLIDYSPKEEVKNENPTFEALTEDEESEKKVMEFCAMTCDKCNYKFTSIKDCLAHYRKDHKIPGYVVCCKRKFNKKGKLFDHVNHHYYPEMFSCDQCKKSFRDRYGLRFHTKTIHSDTKEWKCKICLKSFSKQFKLKSHMDSHIPEEEKKFHCKICDKKFANKNRLDIHCRMNHEGNRPIFVCDICAKKVKSSYTLELHRKEHLNTDPDGNRIHCKECGHWLKGEASFRNHMRRHRESELDNNCKICNKAFANLNLLKSHVKYVHEAEKIHKCNVCEKAFKKLCNLKVTIS